MSSADLDGRDRGAAFAAVDGTSVDLVVIGAGITGAGVARDAALRGLSVVIVDARDIASGTSSRSSKMIHGGLRYLAHGDVGLVREAASERQVLRRIAPHLTRLAPFVMPGSLKGTTTMRAALTAFEKLGGVPKHEKHEVLNAGRLAEREPTLSDGYHSAVVYPEFLTNDARLTLANARSAAAAGAQVLTHAPVVRIVTQGGRATGVECRSALPGEDLGAEISARMIVNAAGPWVDAVRALEDDRAADRLIVTKGIHVVVPHDRLPVANTVITLGKDRRPVFAVPVGPVTYLGTTDTFYPSIDTWPRIESEDVDYLFDAMAATFAGPRLSADDVVAMWSGIRPLVGEAGKKPSEISRKDETWVGPGGVLSIAGGKLTAYRTMAARVVDTVVEHLGVRAAPCATSTELLVGGDGDPAAMRTQLAGSVGDAAAERLVDLFGSEASAVVARGGDVAAEVAHAVEREGALTLEDYWVRRSARAWFTLDPVGDDLTTAAAAMADLLGWTSERTDAEVASCRSIHDESMACVQAAPLPA